MTTESDLPLMDFVNEMHIATKQVNAEYAATKQWLPKYSGLIAEVRCGNDVVNSNLSHFLTNLFRYTISQKSTRRK